MSYIILYLFFPTNHYVELYHNILLEKKNWDISVCD